MNQITLNRNAESSKSLTSNSLNKFKSEKKELQKITPEMSPNEISEIVSEHLITIVKKHFIKK